jgi:hypothetical protein
MPAYIPRGRARQPNLPANCAPDEADAELERALAYRYLGPELGEAYLESTAGAAHSVISIRPERWRTTDFAKM